MNPLPLVIGIVSGPRFPLPLSKEPKSDFSILLVQLERLISL